MVVEYNMYVSHFLFLGQVWSYGLDLNFKQLNLGLDFDLEPSGLAWSQHYLQLVLTESMFESSSFILHVNAK